MCDQVHQAVWRIQASEIDSTIQGMKARLDEVRRVADIVENRGGFQEGCIVANSRGKSTRL